MSNLVEKRHISDIDDDNGIESSKKRLLDSNIELNDENETVADDDDDDNDEDTIEELKVEKKFGICEYTNSNIKGFFGVIKQRYSDFLVNEIDKNGSVVHLTNFTVPSLERPSVALNTDQVEKLKTAIGEEKFNEINEFCNKDDKNIKIQVVAPKDKVERKLVHDYIKSTFTSYISNTVQGSKKDEQLIEIFHKFYIGLNSRDAFRRNDKIPINYCQFVLYKDNIDTLQAVNMLAKHLRIQPKRVGYAGTKDKRAKTCQLMTIYKMEPSEIFKVNEKSNQMKLGNFTLANDALKLGDLSGNRFTIVLRQVNGDDDLIDKCVSSLKENGFINYYGLQRFGTTEVATHEIGKLLLKNNFKEAIDLILKPRKSLKEKYMVKQAREAWENNHDPEEAYDLIQNVNCLERYLLRGLCDCPENDYLGAFNYIPRNMRLMYIHAYQSYIWNMVASERIKKFGLKPIIGDLVYDKTKCDENLKHVIKLDESNISLYQIDDVLLPLPGFNVQYPNNEIYDCYRNLIASDGLDIDKLKNPIRDFSLAGDYRNLIGRPTDIEYEIVYYKDTKTDLVLTDYDLLNNTKLNNVSDKYHETDFPLKALILRFNLKTSSYATMVLREMLKLDTSQGYQASLNKS